MQEAMKHSRLMWLEWRKTGEPEDPTHHLRKRMIEAKQRLRKSQPTRGMQEKKK